MHFAAVSIITVGTLTLCRSAVVCKLDQVLKYLHQHFGEQFFPLEKQFSEPSLVAFLGKTSLWGVGEWNSGQHYFNLELSDAFTERWFPYIHGECPCEIYGKLSIEMWWGFRTDGGISQPNAANRCPRGLVHFEIWKRWISPNKPPLSALSAAGGARTQIQSWNCMW